MGSYTYKFLTEKAEKCYNMIKKEHRNGIYDQWSYYIGKEILTPKKDIKKIGKINDVKNKQGEAVNLEVTKEEYLKLIKWYTGSIEKTKQLPDYIKIHNKKVSIKLWNATVCIILLKYYKTGKLPASQKIKSTIYGKKQKFHNYFTNTGCSGMGQCTGYNCACNSLQQAFYRLTGIKVDESTIAKWAGTTTSGTSHEGINTAVAKFNKKYGKNVKIVWYNFSELGKTSNARWEKVKELMKKGALFFHLLYRYNPGIQDGWGHYEVPLSIGNSLKILNSLGSNCGGSTYCGYIETRTRREQETYISGIGQKSVAYLYNG